MEFELKQLGTCIHTLNLHTLCCHLESSMNVVVAVVFI